jgi:hypothetical protein
MRETGGLVADCPMRSDETLLVLAPILQLFPGVGKRQKPVRSARRRPLNASRKALSVGLPGREKSSVTPFA